MQGTGVQVELLKLELKRRIDELEKKKGEMDSGTVFFMLCTGVITFMIFTGEQLIGPIIDIFLIPLGVMMIALPAIQARQIKYEIDQLKQKLNRY